MLDEFNQYFQVSLSTSYAVDKSRLSAAVTVKNIFKIPITSNESMATGSEVGTLPLCFAASLANVMSIASTSLKNQAWNIKASNLQQFPPSLLAQHETKILLVCDSPQNKSGKIPINQETA